jgi:hypothetical protein
MLDRAPERIGVRVELCAEGAEQTIDVGFGNRHDDIDIQGRARFAGRGAGERSAHQVTKLTAVQCVGDLKGDVEWTDHWLDKRGAASGYTSRARSGPSVRIARWRNRSR